MYPPPAKAPKVTDVEFVVVREPLARRIAQWIATIVVFILAHFAYRWLS